MTVSFSCQRNFSKEKNRKEDKGREKVQQGFANVTLLIREKRRWCSMSQRDLACRREREEERHEENRWSLKTEMRKRMAVVHERRQDMKTKKTLSLIYGPQSMKLRPG